MSKRQFAQHGPDATRHELLVAAKLKEHFQWECVTTPQFCHYDLIASKGDKVIAIVEVKHRNITIQRHPTIHVSATKLYRCLATAEEMGIGFVFAVSCDTGMYAASLTRFAVDQMHREEGGRRDRGLKHDIEVMVHIPTDLFFTL